MDALILCQCCQCSESMMLLFFHRLGTLSMISSKCYLYKNKRTGITWPWLLQCRLSCALPEEESHFLTHAHRICIDLFSGLHYADVLGYIELNHYCKYCVLNLLDHKWIEAELTSHIVQHMGRSSCILINHAWFILMKQECENGPTVH